MRPAANAALAVAAWGLLFLLGVVAPWVYDPLPFPARFLPFALLSAFFYSRALRPRMGAPLAVLLALALSVATFFAWYVALVFVAVARS